MGTESAISFIAWALLHARPDTIPSNATLVVAAERCGVDPWEYLPGTNGQFCNSQMLEDTYETEYKALGWDKLTFETITFDWPKRSVPVCDGPGLLNAYFNQVQGSHSAMTAHGIFSRLCYDRVAIDGTFRAFELGESVFIANRHGVMKRVGWVCGFDTHGEPLVVEARGLAYGICVEKLIGQGWTHRAQMQLCQKKEDVDER